MGGGAGCAIPSAGLAATAPHTRPAHMLRITHLQLPCSSCTTHTQPDIPSCSRTCICGTSAAATAHSTVMAAPAYRWGPGNSLPAVMEKADGKHVHNKPRECSG